MELDQALSESTVILLALGGYEADPQRLARAVAYFQRRFRHVIVAPPPERISERFSATDSERLGALQAALVHPDVGLVIGLRGGYGVSRILGSIDFAAIAQSIQERGVFWVGQSDWTALTLALLAKTGAVSFAGPMAGPDFGAEHVDAYTETHFWSALAGDPLTVQWSTKESSIDVEGMLWGGSLAMICSLIGTPYLPAVDGGILFVEDVNEHPYRIERMLLQLDEVGILRRQQALVLGDFTSYRTTDYDRGYGLASVVDFLQKRIGIPIITGLPFGHAAQKLTLPVGAIVRLRAQGPQMHLSSAPPASQRALQ